MNLSPRWRSFRVAVLALCAAVLPLHAETVKEMPAPTGYVTDLAGVLSSDTKQQLEALCTQVDQQAHAQIAVAVIQTTGDEDIDEFGNELFAKWKIGPKGTDKGVLLLLAAKDHKYRVEVGYGLEGTINDARAGDIGRSMVPYLRSGDYDSAVTSATSQLAQLIAQDANVTLTTMPAMQQSLPQQQPVTKMQRGFSFVAFIIIALVVIFVLSHAGPSGLLWFLLGNALGSGGRDDRGGGGFGGGGGGFGGFGGGGSGGGGASGGW